MSAPQAITIGTFDGVHRGHQRLLKVARAAAGVGGRVRAITFEPSPLAVLRPQHPPPRLTSAAERRDLLLAAGADHVDELDPRGGLLELSPEAFADLLVDRFAPSAVVEGPDFRFGHRRAGDLDVFRRLLEPHDAQVIVVDAVEAALCDQTIVPVSSTLIRRLLALGRTRDAAQLLGRRFAIRAHVVSGDRRGRTIGFPTVNLDTGDRLLPADGIYAGRATLPDGRRFPAAISVGTKPTFGPCQRTCEAHLVGYEGPVDSYGWTAELVFGDWLRGQITYRHLDALLEQIRRDCARTVEREHVA